MRKQLTETVEKQWPISSVRLRCEGCETTLFERTYDELTIQTPSYVVELIFAFMKRHGWRGDVAIHVPHYHVDIDYVAPVEEIDVDISVGPVSLK